MKYRDKECTSCYQSFTPSSGRQTICQHCRKPRKRERVMSTVPQSLPIYGIINRESRSKRVKLALKLAQKSQGVSSLTQYVENLISYARWLAVGYEPSELSVLAALGHKISEKP